MKRLLIVSLLARLLLAAVPAAAQVGLQVSPMKIWYRPGESPTSLIRVTNPTPNRITLQVSCADWRRDTLGSKQYFPAQSLPVSCCPYLRFTPAVLELGPNEEKNVAVSVQVSTGQKLPGELNSMVFLTQVAEQRPSASANVAVGLIIRVEIGVQVFFVPTALRQRELEIGSVRISPEVKELPRQVQVFVQNRGELDLESQLRVELLNLDTDEEVKLPVVPFNSLPGDQYWVSQPLPAGLKKGAYLVTAIADSGPDTALKVAEIELSIP